METQGLDMPTVGGLTDEQFYQLCVANKQWQLELTAEGRLIMMPQDENETAVRNLELIAQLANWNHYKKAGYVFSSSTEFHLPNGAYRSPDISWVVFERWQALSFPERRLFPRICPDFVMEVRSRHDSLEELRSKMREYRQNGTRLGWLIDLESSLVEIYRDYSRVQTINFLGNNPPILSGEDVMPGFSLDLDLIYDLY